MAINTDFLFFLNLLLSSLPPKLFHILIQVQRCALAKILNNMAAFPFCCLPYKTYETLESGVCSLFLTKPVSVVDFYFLSAFNVSPINQKISLSEAFFVYEDCKNFDWENVIFLCFNYMKSWYREFFGLKHWLKVVQI